MEQDEFCEVAVGGGFLPGQSTLQCKSRNATGAIVKSDDIGFRLVLTE